MAIPLSRKETLLSLGSAHPCDSAVEEPEPGEEPEPPEPGSQVTAMYTPEALSARVWYEGYGEVPIIEEGRPHSSN